MLPAAREAMKDSNWPRALDLIAMMPDDGPVLAEASYLASVCLMNLGELDHALSFAQSAVLAAPTDPRIWSQLGAVHYMMADSGPGHYLEAHVCFERAYNINAAIPAAAMGLAGSAFTLGQYDLALQLFRQAQTHGAYPQARMSEAGVLLKMGHYKEGWEKWEARLVIPGDEPPAPPHVVHIADLIGKTVIVRAEQGFGDNIQFLRYLPHLQKFCSAVIVDTYPELVGLVHAIMPNVHVVESMEQISPIPVDAIQIAIMSLPLLLGPAVGWGPIPPITIHQPWRKPGSGIGVCSASVPKMDSEGNRFGAPMVRRKNPPQAMFDELLAPWVSRSPVRSLLQADLRSRDWLDTAVTVSELELVITVETGVAHLAASLGIETWVLQHFDACWRLGMTGEKTAWYPSMRVFRQPAPGDWGAVFRQVHKALELRE